MNLKYTREANAYAKEIVEKFGVSDESGDIKNLIAIAWLTGRIAQCKENLESLKEKNDELGKMADGTRES